MRRGNSNPRTSDIGPGTKTMIAKDTRHISIGKSRSRNMNTSVWTLFWSLYKRRVRRETSSPLQLGSGPRTKLDS